VDENMDAEIFGLLLEEAKEAYDEEIVIELTSENSDEIESNCARITAWVEAWKRSHSEEATDA
jgi:adenylate kinase